MNRPSPIDCAKEIFISKYPDANFLLLAGSVVRGEGTETSDLDIVVVYEDLESAYSQSFFQKPKYVVSQ